MYDIIIIGFGISTLCFLLYLFKNNLINKYKILILEKNNIPCKDSLNYININSNSTLESLISIFRNSIFDDIINKVEKDYNLNTFINLSNYNKIISEISIYFLKKLKKINNIKIKFNEEINNIEYFNNYIKINNFISKTCIISIGAKQDIEFIKDKDIDNLFNNDFDKCVLPHNIFNNSYNINKLKNKKIAIIGSSHSSLSIIDCLLFKKINCKSITLLCKKDFKVFFKNIEDCEKNKYKYNKDDICSETKMINRFDGLRENSKKIYMNLNNYNIKKICNDKIKCNDYDIIIPCWGYYKKLPKINNILYKQNIDSNNNFELKIKNKIFNNIFLLGICSNSDIKITQKSFKKSIDGRWIYYNIISNKLYKILERRIDDF